MYKAGTPAQAVQGFVLQCILLLWLGLLQGFYSGQGGDGGWSIHCTVIWFFWMQKLQLTICCSCHARANWLCCPSMDDTHDGLLCVLSVIKNNHGSLHTTVNEFEHVAHMMHLVSLMQCSYSHTSVTVD